MTRQVRKAKTLGAVIVYELSKVQTEFWTAAERYVDFEGAVRAGQTTSAVLKVLNSCIEHPGIQWLIARWTQDSTDAQLKARSRELCPAHALLGWNAQKQHLEIRTGNKPSRICVRGLKASEDSVRDGTPRSWSATGAVGCVRFRRVKDGVPIKRVNGAQNLPVIQQILGRTRATAPPDSRPNGTVSAGHD